MTTLSPAASEICAQLIAAAELRALPWKNGGGVTREIACHPPGAGYESFLWRISVADVAQPGPFSRFPGIDRSIVLMQGGPMVLVFSDGGPTHTLRPWEPLRFAGEAALDAQLPAGPTRDFNVMSRRTAVAAHLELRQSAQTLVLGRGTTLLHCAAGVFGATPLDADWPDDAALPAPRGRQVLREGDTLRLDLRPGAALTLALDALEPASRLIDVRLEETVQAASPDAGEATP